MSKNKLAMVVWEATESKLYSAMLYAIISYYKTEQRNNSIHDTGE